MPSRPWPRCIVAGLLLIAAAASAPAAAQPAAVPSIRLTLPPSQEHWRAPLVEAAQHTATLAADWLGPHPSGSIDLAVAPPVWQGPGAMAAERQVAAAVVRSWWPRPLADQHAEAILDGFAEYLQGLAIEQLFNRRHLRRAHRAESIRYFGGHVVWSLPALRRSRWSDATDRHAAVFVSLERWLGEPALQGAMAAVAAAPAGTLTGGAVINTLSAAAGQDLGWIFTPAADPAAAVDYAVTDLSSGSGGCGAACVETTVTVTRLGNAAITGRSSPRIGPFDSGDAIALRLTFDNGGEAWARWDGRDETRTFRFHGPSRAVAAHLDPDRTIVLDRNRLNNASVLASPTNVPLRKWMARWITWMQNTMLSWGFFA